MIIEMVAAWKDTAMEIDMKESSRITNLMVKAFTHGLTGRCTKASGRMDLKKGKGFGRVFSEIRTSVSGLKVKLMVTEFINGKMETDTKESGSFV